MFSVALILLGSGIVSLLLIIFSSFSTAKKSDKAIEQILRKRRSNLNKNEFREIDYNRLPYIKKIELLREMYPVGTMLNLVDVTRGARLFTDIRGIVTKVDEHGLIHCQIEDGDMVVLNPESDIFQLINIKNYNINKS